ncbi:hypothetical protein C0J52_01981 [Blattella germanica]|nr:hypothetical protein C0J52_01981 [Blattella germanica]
MAAASIGQQAVCLAVSTLRLPPVISLDEVAFHDMNDDCWLVLYDRVYDVTQFLRDHPGGEEILLEYAGRDATLAFRGIGHELDMLQALEPHLVGVLPPSQRIWAGGKLEGYRST